MPKLKIFHIFFTCFLLFVVKRDWLSSYLHICCNTMVNGESRQHNGKYLCFLSHQLYSVLAVSLYFVLFLAAKKSFNTKRLDQAVIKLQESLERR